MNYLHIEKHHNVIKINLNKLLIYKLKYMIYYFFTHTPHIL